MISADDPSQRVLRQLGHRLRTPALAREAFTFDVGDIRDSFPRCPLGSDNDVVYVEEIQVQARLGCGIGRELMRILLSLADAGSVTVVLNPAAFGSDEARLTQEDLEAWYLRLGFVKWYGAHMTRPPNPALSQPRLLQHLDVSETGGARRYAGD